MGLEDIRTNNSAKGSCIKCEYKKNCLDAMTGRICETFSLCDRDARTKQEEKHERNFITGKRATIRLNSTSKEEDESDAFFRNLLNR